MRVLVVDDHDEVRSLVRRALESDGHAVRTVSTVAAAKDALENQVADVIVLDIGLPDGSGLDLCRNLRRDGDGARILLLTARVSVGDRVAGLDRGADDFLGKPFAVPELRARVRALGRRGPLPRGFIRTLGTVELDFGARAAKVKTKAVPLTAREWALLELLALREGRVVSQSEILEVVWGDDSDRAGGSLHVIITRIRRKLGEGIVRTLRGEGYALGE